MPGERRRVRSFDDCLLSRRMIRDVFAAAITTRRRRRRRSGIEHFDRSVGRARRHSLFLCIIVIIIQFDDDDDDWF